MRRWSLLVLLAGAGLTFASTSLSQQAAPRACSHGERSAMVELACELGRQLNLETGTLITVGPIASDQKLRDADALSQRIARVIGGALGPTLRVHDEPATLAEAQALGGDRFLYLSPELRDGALRVRADAYVRPRAFWDRVKATSTGPTAHAFAERPADAEVRSFLPRPPLTLTQRTHVPTPDRSAVALACGDTNGDGGPELAIIGRRVITLGRLGEKHFTTEAELEWDRVAPLAAAPLRAPLAGAQAEGASLLVGSSDRAKLIRLDGALRVIAVHQRALPVGLRGCMALGPRGASLAFSSCLPGDATPPPPLALPDSLAAIDEVDAWADAYVSTPEGRLHEVTVTRPIGTTTALVFNDEGRNATLENVGAQLAIGDLDGDGAPEIVTSRPTFDASKDSLRVDTWRPGQPPKTVVEVPLSGIRALAICPWPGHGLAPLAVATDEAIWVLR